MSTYRIKPKPYLGQTIVIREDTNEELCVTWDEDGANAERIARALELLDQIEASPHGPLLRAILAHNGAHTPLPFDPDDYPLY